MDFNAKDGGICSNHLVVLRQVLSGVRHAKADWAGDVWNEKKHYVNHNQRIIINVAMSQ